MCGEIAACLTIWYDRQMREVATGYTWNERTTGEKGRAERQKQRKRQRERETEKQKFLVIKDSTKRGAK